MFKTLLSEIKEYKKATILTPLLMILEVAMEMVIPLLMASIIDQGVNAGDMHHIIVVGVWMVASAIVGLLAGIGGGFYAANASAGFAKNLRARMFRNIQTFSFSDIDSFSQASLITRMTTDVTSIQNAFQMILRMGMRAPTSLIVAMLLSFHISRSLSSIFLAAIVFLAIVMVILILNIRKVFEVIFARYDAMNESVRENVTAIRVVKAFVREPFEKEKFKNTSKRIYTMFMKVEAVMVILMPIMMGVVYTTILLLCWFGARNIVYGNLTTGELVSLLAYSMNILISMMLFAMIFGMIAISIAPTRRVAEVISHEASIHNPKDPLTEVPDGRIAFDHVTFGYHQSAKELVLKDIHLEIAAGETIGIIGGTGSAKTTMISLISRLYDVTDGSVSVGGHDVREYDLETLRNEVSVVLQNNVLFSGTILENLRWGNPNATEEECQKACQLACADEFIERFPERYETHIEQGGANVSGGQKQRICIARALLKKPKILILDDSTSAVDTSTDAKIRRAFREEIPGTTKLIIAQRISSVQDADRIIVMDDGCISGIGTHEELLVHNHIYKDVYESQTSGANADFDKVG